MKRLLVTAAIAAMLLTPLAAAGQDRGERSHGERRYESSGRGGERGNRGEGRYEGRGAYGGPRGGGYEERGPYGGRGSGGYEPRYADPRYAEPRYAPPPMPRAAPRSAAPSYAAPSGRSWRRGESLPPTYRGGVVRDPGRYRLRQAPPGYDWVGVGPDIYLMQRGTGMVLDSIPGGY